MTLARCQSIAWQSFWWRDVIIDPHNVALPSLTGLFSSAIFILWLGQCDISIGHLMTYLIQSTLTGYIAYGIYRGILSNISYIKVWGITYNLSWVYLLSPSPDGTLWAVLICLLPIIFPQSF